jgi:hypothetical protein
MKVVIFCDGPGVRMREECLMVGSARATTPISG